MTNDADPVRDEAEDFAKRLSAAGVPVLGLRTRGMMRAAWLLPKVLPQARLLFELESGAAMRRGSLSNE